MSLEQTLQISPTPRKKPDSSSWKLAGKFSTSSSIPEDSCKTCCTPGYPQTDADYKSRYDMSNSASANPLDDGEETLGGGYITITPWRQFRQPEWNPLRMHPVTDVDLPLVEKDGKLRPRSCDEKTKVRVEEWVDCLSRDTSVTDLWDGNRRDSICTTRSIKGAEESEAK